MSRNLPASTTVMTSVDRPPTRIQCIRPDWPQPPAVRACSTTRAGGVSRGPWSGLNLGDHVDDDPAAVAENRARLAAHLGLPREPQWLEQVHGTRVRMPGAAGTCADACVEDRPGRVCVVLTADCLPVLLCNVAGTRVAAAHAGWRGLLAGVLEQTVAAFDDRPGRVMAWLGPAIGPDAFEVGDEVRAAFVAEDAAAQARFRAHGAGHWLADLYGLARDRLARVGVSRVSGGGLCTFSTAERFFSYRRDGITGRMASLIWLQP
jgi:YfiH family protein